MHALRLVLAAPIQARLTLARSDAALSALSATWLARSWRPAISSSSCSAT